MGWTEEDYETARQAFGEANVSLDTTPGGETTKTPIVYMPIAVRAALRAVEHRLSDGASLAQRRGCGEPRKYLALGNKGGIEIARIVAWKFEPNFTKTTVVVDGYEVEVEGNHCETIAAAVAGDVKTHDLVQQLETLRKDFEQFKGRATKAFAIGTPGII